MERFLKKTLKGLAVLLMAGVLMVPAASAGSVAPELDVYQTQAGCPGFLARPCEDVDYICKALMEPCLAPDMDALKAVNGDACDDGDRLCRALVNLCLALMHPCPLSDGPSFRVDRNLQ